jgi:hypothetical protein
VGTHHPVPNPNPTGEFRTQVMNTIYINNMSMFVCVCVCVCVYSSRFIHNNVITVVAQAVVIVIGRVYTYIAYYKYKPPPPVATAP